MADICAGYIYIVHIVLYVYNVQVIVHTSTVVKCAYYIHMYFLYQQMGDYTSYMLIVCYGDVRIYFFFYRNSIMCIYNITC